jgi:hypothetical protein
LSGQIQDRKVKIGQYKALVQQGQQLKHQQKGLLFEQEQAGYQRVRRQKAIAELEDFEIRLKGAQTGRIL